MALLADFYKVELKWIYTGDFTHRISNGSVTLQVLNSPGRREKMRCNASKLRTDKWLIEADY